MHTARSSPYGGSVRGGLPDRPSQTDPPPDRVPHWTETPLDGEPPRKNVGPGKYPPSQEEHGTRQPDRKRHHRSTASPATHTSPPPLATRPSTCHAPAIMHALCYACPLPCTPSPPAHSSGSRGGAEGAMPPPSPVQISHKKDDRQRRPHRFHVSWPPPPTWPLDPMLAHAPFATHAPFAIHPAPPPSTK